MLKNTKYYQAINAALLQAMHRNSDVMVIGQLVDSISGVFGTTSGLIEEFGPTRVMDFPVSESLMTSMSIGLAVSGKRPVLVHQRLDFSLYAMDAITNWMSLWRFKSGGKSVLPVTIRAIVGKGWGQGPQHSKSLYSWFGHLPGIKTCVPSNPVDAKGMLLNAIFDDNPVLVIENRALFNMSDDVPSDPYQSPLETAKVVQQGQDLTLVSFGNELQICRRALSAIREFDIELIDLRSIKPLDTKTVCESVKKTGRLMVVEGDWESYGIASEVITKVVEDTECQLAAPPVRLTYPDSHTPTSYMLERCFYLDEDDIIANIKKSFV